jgi:hypothetical protein
MPTLVLQPPEGDPTHRDTYIASGVYQGTNFGNDIFVSVGVQNIIKEAYSLFRAILRFDLTALIGATILDAALTLTYSHGNVTNETFRIHRLTQPNWTEFGTTWNNYDVATPWATPGGDFVATPTQSLVLSSPGNLVFDQVKPLVEDAIRYRGGLLDVLIKSAELSFQILNFHSSGNATPANRPTLLVNYTHNIWCVDTDDSEVWAVDVTDEAC